MRCSRFSVFGLVLSLVFFSVLFLNVNNVSATSVTCTSSFTDIVSAQSYDFMSDCDTSSLDSSSVWYYFPSFSSDSLSVNRNVTSYICFSSTSSSCNFASSSPYSVSYRIDSRTFITSIPFSFFGTSRFSYFRIDPNSGSLSYTGTIDFSVIIYDSISSDCPVCEECQQCPAIPENPYDDKFDKLITAIYVCAATLLVIYFFYCIYRMIIKSSGGYNA